MIMKKPKLPVTLLIAAILLFIYSALDLFVREDFSYVLGVLWNVSYIIVGIGLLTRIFAISAVGFAVDVIVSIIWVVQDLGDNYFWPGIVYDLCGAVVPIIVIVMMIPLMSKNSAGIRKDVDGLWVIPGTVALFGSFAYWAQAIPYYLGQGNIRIVSREVIWLACWFLIGYGIKHLPAAPVSAMYGNSLQQPSYPQAPYQQYSGNNGQASPVRPVTPAAPVTPARPVQQPQGTPVQQAPHVTPVRPNAYTAPVTPVQQPQVTPAPQPQATPVQQMPPTAPGRPAAYAAPVQQTPPTAQAAPVTNAAASAAASEVAASVTGALSADKIETLRRSKALMDAGVISRQEFEELKNKLLG